MINKYTIGLLVAVVLFLGGFYTGKGQKEIEIQEKVTTVKGETEVVIRDRIVTVTRIQKPDGTIEEKTVTEDKDRKETSKQSQKTADTSTVSTPKLSNYSLGLKYWVPIADSIDVGRTRDRNNYEVTAGYRLIGEVWLDAGYRLDKQMSIGVSIRL